MDNTKLIPAGMIPPGMIPVGMTLAAAAAVIYFIKNPMVRGAALGVIGVVVAKQLPVVNGGLA